MKYFNSLKFVIILWMIIFATWGFAMVYDWYFYYGWMDIILHFAGGFWVFVLIRHVTDHYNLEITGVHKEIARFFIFISFVAFAGVLWEFFEFVLDRYITFTGFTYLSKVFEDTLSDLASDIFGGIIAFLLYFKNGRA